MLKGLGGLGDMAKMMKQAQEVQGKMAQMQEDLENVLVEGVSGAGLVRATATAKGELKALDIDPSIFNKDEKEVVEDLILAAIKDAQAKATERAQEEMAKLTQFDCIVGIHGGQPSLIFTVGVENTTANPLRYRINIFLEDMDKAAGHLVPRNGKPPVLEPGKSETVKIPFIGTGKESKQILVVVKTISSE